MSDSAKQLSSKIIQIQTSSSPGDSNCGPHTQLFVLCQDGSLWVKYFSSGFSNVPTDGLWRQVHAAATEHQDDGLVVAEDAATYDVTQMKRHD